MFSKIGLVLLSILLATTLIVNAESEPRQSRLADVDTLRTLDIPEVETVSIDPVVDFTITDGNGEQIIKDNTPPPDPLAKVKSFLATRSAHRFSDQYLTSLYNNCNQDLHYVRLYIAISGHESAFGTKGHANDGIGSDVNYIGWMHWPNGRRAIRDYETIDQFTSHICARFTNPAYYHGERIIGRDGNVFSYANVNTYAGSDRSNIWATNVSNFYKAML